MSEIDVRDLHCENCRKFSHCNNNDLVCIKKFQQLKAENEELKEECERLKKLGSYGILLEVKKNRQIEQCLDEIEHILEVNKRELDECLHNDIGGQILSKIKGVKG